MPRSSKPSDTIYVLKPEPCRLRAACWALAHALGAAGVAGSGLPVAVRLAVGAGLVWHWALRAPAPAPLLLVTGAGRWSVPGRGPYARRAGPGTAYTSLWVRLVLGRGRRAERFVLLRPEYRAADWRRIQLALRAPAAAEAPRGPGGRGREPA